MALLKIDLRLDPAKEGGRELSLWPETSFTPDFAVAASGKARFELDGKLIAVAAGDREPIAVAASGLHGEPLDPWLPDYIAGFALNLAQAAAQIRSHAKAKTAARFLDEPLELRLERDKHDPQRLSLSIHFGSATIAKTEGSAVLLLAEIGRALQDFMVQLLNLNPRLSEYSEVVQLRGLIAQIVS